MNNKSLINIQSPEQLTTFSGKLKDFIVSQNLYTQIQGKNYVNIEGWQFAGGNMGLLPVVESCERLDRTDKEIAYKASVALYSGERIVSRGIAICSSKENKRRNADEYVIASMAQTRAEGKAYRLILGWLMKVAGYEATPAEEMPKKGFKNKGQNFDPKTELQPTCSICGQKAIKGQYGWYCPDYKKHKADKKKPEMLYPETPKTKAEQKFEEELGEIQVEDIL